MPKVGEKAPDFELLSDEGRRVKLSDFRGQKIILYFYPKASTPGGAERPRPKDFVMNPQNSLPPMPW